MAGQIRVLTSIEFEGKTYTFETKHGTTLFNGKTIPQPYRRRIDASFRTIAENLRFLEG